MDMKEFNEALVKTTEYIQSLPEEQRPAAYNAAGAMYSIIIIHELNKKVPVVGTLALAALAVIGVNALTK